MASWAKETHDADLGLCHVSVGEREHVAVTVWGGVLAIAARGTLMVLDPRRA